MWLKDKEDQAPAQRVEEHGEAGEEPLSYQTVDLHIPAERLQHERRQGFAQRMQAEYLAGQRVLQQAGQEA